VRLENHPTLFRGLDATRLGDEPSQLPILKINFTLFFFEKCMVLLFLLDTVGTARCLVSV